MSGGIPSSHKVKLTVNGVSLEGALAPLAKTGGVVFPYSPTIQVSHQANYGTYDVAHSVYQANYWVNTRNPSISLTAQFASQTHDDAEYNAAALHFFKSMTKGEFGRSSGNPGVPPPVLKFSAFGELNMKNVPVILTGFSYTLPEDIDYVSLTQNGIDVSVPALFLASIELQVQQRPVNVRNTFNAGQYRDGSLLKRGFM